MKESTESRTFTIEHTLAQHLSIVHVTSASDVTHVYNAKQHNSIGDTYTLNFE